VPGLGGYTDPFLSKRVAWINHVVAAASGMGPEKDVNWDWGVMPRQKKQVTWAAGSGWAVSGKAKEPDGAWLFVKEITSSPNLSAIAKSQRGYPARYSAMPAYFQGRPKHVEYAKSVMEYARGYPTHPTFLEWWDVLNRELEPVLLGSASAKDTVAKIKPELDNLLTKSRQLSG
jgi:ABC-type glycerol-3-phosphate transport system substrate-binding protein